MQKEAGSNIKTVPLLLLKSSGTILANTMAITQQ